MTPLRRQVKRVSETKGLTIKQIVNLCECSRSHFYKVLDGQRSPSESLQVKLMAVLEISEAELISLLQANKGTEQAKKSTDTLSPKTFKLSGITKRLKSQSLTSYIIWLVSLTFLLVFSYYFHVFISGNLNEKIELKTGLATKFIRDVTIPDGTPIPINTKFIKTWRIQNIGTVPWKGKHLKRITPQDPNLCYSKDSITLPTVESGEIIDISIEFTTPKYPGTCRTDWKMVDAHENLIFPDKQGLYSIVHVVEEKL